MSLGRFAARAVIGGLFVGHGTQKLFGWFDGPGLSGTAPMMSSLGMNPGKRNAVAAGATEAAGGALLVAGLATPLAASSLIGTMVTAIRKVHGVHGPWSTNGGYEYNLVLIAALMAIVDGGPGALSLDRAFGWDDTGSRWALASLAIGAAASAAVVTAGGRSVPEPSDVTGIDAGVRQATDAPAGDPTTVRP